MNSKLVNHPQLADSDAEADKRFRLTKQTDPFPEIAAALLNSADIHDYVRMTGMVHPFNLGKLKSGSYEAAIRGHCIWWNEDGNRQEKLLTKVDGTEHFILKANSIAFVQVEPSFRLPDYIALRFNLKISHVHRGILLGTGPLIDPGFEGKLLIPLHNLTTNDYKLQCGSGLIWLEFTKMSPLPGADRDKQNSLEVTRQGIYKEFPSDKKWKEPIYYLSNAFDGPIRSSIPEAVRASVQASKESAISAESSKSDAQASRSDAERARNEVTKSSNRIQVLTGLVSAAFIAALASVGVSMCNLIQDTGNIAREVQHQLQQKVAGDLSEAKEVEQAVKKVQSIEAKVTEEIAVLRDELGGLRNNIRVLREKSKESKPKSGTPAGQTAKQ
jgi:deoxycytidine triphosphate deaminase